MWKYALLKKTKKTIAKKFMLIFSGTVIILKNYSWHNSMAEKCPTLFKYEMQDIFVEIIHFKTFSSLKSDGV